MMLSNGYFYELALQGYWCERPPHTPPLSFPSDSSQLITGFLGGSSSDIILVSPSLPFLLESVGTAVVE
jgi:hypothetical protein